MKNYCPLAYISLLIFIGLTMYYISPWCALFALLGFKCEDKGE